jgi:AcrR family transcriptional regulator
MSSGDPETRKRILFAAQELMRRALAPLFHGPGCRHAGVSRQALYLHFADRASLWLEVSRRADVSARTPDRQRRVDEAPTAREAFREAIALQATIKPELRGVATSMDVLRRSDLTADAVWQEREHMRLQRCQVITRLHAAGDLAAQWSIDTAARLMWAITSTRVGRPCHRPRPRSQRRRYEDPRGGTG